MDRLFDFNNPFWSGMEDVFDVFVLNILWLLCCLPVFTIGPATTALFYAMINLVRREEHFVWKDFFHSFKDNFRQGVSLGLPFTAVGVFLIIDISMCHRAGTGIYTFFMVLFSIMFLVWALLALYSFPLLAKFHKNNREILAWAYALSIRNLHLSLLMLGAWVLALWACHILSGLAFIVFGLAAKFHATLIASILKTYLPASHTQEPLKPLIFDTTEEDRNEQQNP